MKKKYTLLLIAFIGFIGNTQIVNIPDTAFKARLLAASTSNTIAKNLAGNYFQIDANNDGEIQALEALQVSSLNISSSNSTIVSITGISSFTNLTYLYTAYCNHITTMDLTALTNLVTLNALFNNLSTLNIEGLTNLQWLGLTGNNLTSLDISSLTGLQTYDCSRNHFTTLQIDNMPNLQSVTCQYNHMTTLTLNGLPNLSELDCSLNQISTLNLDALTNLTTLNCSYNVISTLNLNALTNLTRLDCYYNVISTLDISNSPNLFHLYCDGNQLTSLYIKNGKNENDLNFSGNPTLQYICADDGQINYIQYLITTYSYTNCFVNSYCSFVPGGTFYTIQGNNRFDLDNNGCDNSDINIPNLKLSFSNGTATSSFIPDRTGTYHYDVPASTQTFSPVFENPTYFTASPNPATVTFPGTASPFIQDFCVTATGNHDDLEVTLLPMSSARPGFDAAYKIIYKNKGTTTQNGTVSLDYYNPIEDFVSANPNFTSETSSFMNTLNWSFTNLLPFEIREITVVFNLNSPTETPPVNAGNIVDYTARITGATDETPSDNTSYLPETIVNSYDPNVKTCTESNNLPVSEVGKYLHYIIRFENNGSANAQNIVVKDIIDTTKLDINTLIPLTGSHIFDTKISFGNRVEFVFQNINLPFDDANNDGYVAFKIKSLPTLIEGNVINNSANIYFDYNAPIITNTNTVNVFNPLGIPGFEFGSVFTLSPVPAKNSLTVAAKQDVVISSISIYNTVGQLVQVITTPSETIDVSGLKTGSYFIKIISDKGTASSKFIKE